MNGDSIEFLSAWSYTDRDTMGVAEDAVEVLLACRDVMREREANGVPPLPAWQDASDSTVASKIVGALMDAGWRPPPREEIDSAVARVEREQAETQRRMAALSDVDRAALLDHYNEHGEMPSWWPLQDKAGAA